MRLGLLICWTCCPLPSLKSCCAPPALGFVPAQSPERVVRSLFRHHPKGLTRLEVKRYTGLNNGKVAAIVCQPAYKMVGQRVDRQYTSQVWVPTIPT